VKIWPAKEIESGATISSSIIWGAQGRRSLFGRFGVTGLVNVDLTPEFAAKLGAAYGGILSKGSIVTVNRDSHSTPRMLKRAMISGLPSAGISVLDLRNVPIPVARYYTRVIGAAGGVHVRLSPFDARVVDIKFFDKRGLDLDKAAERKIEGFFFRDDCRRVYLDDIGRIDYANDVEQRYNSEYLNGLDVETIRNADPKYTRIAVDYANSSSSMVLPNLLGQLNTDVIALNAMIQEASLYQTDAQFDEATERLASITRTVEAGFGVRLDPGGERVVFVDGRGKRVPEMTTLAVVVDLALAQHFAKNGAGGIAVVPVYAPSIFEKIAAKYGAEIVRARFNSYAIMAAALRTGVVVAGDTQAGVGGFIFPQFHPASDGLFTIAKVLELTASQGVTFTEAIDRLPRYATSSARVPCAWENKGRVMRILNEQYRDSATRQVDGVKIDLGKGEWALILPDADRPIFHVIAEATSESEARKLVDKYAGLVQGLQ
jgi:mannose-1-phosphate guanylyltransferase/phosphomannomutase